MSGALRTIHVSTRSSEVTLARVEAYLWRGWTAVWPKGGDTIVINGYDNAGWTAEALVERLASGLIIGKVVR